MVANDVYASDTSSFQIIQGPKSVTPWISQTERYAYLLTRSFAFFPLRASSMSGKSTYIQTVGLMASRCRVEYHRDDGSTAY